MMLLKRQVRVWRIRKKSKKKENMTDKEKVIESQCKGKKKNVWE